MFHATSNTDQRPLMTVLILVLNLTVSEFCGVGWGGRGGQKP